MTFTIKTIGCKVNTYESNKIKAELQNAGLIFIDVNEKDSYKNIDFYIINTCSVTSIADKKSRQMIHKAKTLNKNLKVIATGCYVDAHIDELDSEIDVYVKNAEKMSVVTKVLELAGEKNITKDFNNAYHPSHIREFIKIQDGCNQYCTYCIIPFLRGNIVSRDDLEIIEEIKEKVKKGTKEIVLTGIHLSSFGVDRESKNYEQDGAIDIGRSSLLKLINDIADIKIKNDTKGKDFLGNDLADVLEVERIRLGSLEPRIINEDFIKELENEKFKEKFCANFCLSLQSGCDKTLKKMNRHYSTSDFENAVNVIREHLPDATITTDIIVGFPGETKEDFETSLAFVKKMRFYNPNVFPYSRRKGTLADTYDDQLTRDEKHERAVKMIAECEKITKEIEENYDFTKHKILVEEIVDEGDKRYAIGYTKEYIKRKLLF